MEYIKEGYTLPVPFNLIPTISSIKKMYNLVTTCWAKIKRHEQDQTNNNAGHVEGIRQKENLKIKTTIIFVFPITKKTNKIKTNHQTSTKHHQ